MADDILKQAQEAFEACAEAESENRIEALADIRFAKLDEHWPEKIKRQRELDGLPCLTIPKLPPMIRQVVNDARLNKPSIVVHPVDSESDPEVAEVFNGLIRHIEQSSNAEVAYDTALDFAVTGGFGYFRINTKYCRDDSFDQDLVIERVADPFTVYGDPESTAADSSDWSVAFVTERMAKATYERRFGGADAVDWDASEWSSPGAPWLDGDHVLVAEYWTREETTNKIVMLSDGSVVRLDAYEAERAMYDAIGAAVEGQPREVPSHKVTMRLMSGAEELEKRSWGGRYIPIVPVYGEEVFIDGRRRLRGLVRSAKDAQRMVNYWRTKSTEAVALAPLAPFIGQKGQFETDAAKWATANRDPHAYLEYDAVEGSQGAPQRTAFAGIPAGAIQEALNAADDIKAIVGMYDASLGARSNETSGKAIQARQREGDVSTFHFIDNQARAIRHAGRILLDLIPKVYASPRVLRILGPEGKPDMVPVNQKAAIPVKGPDGEPVQDPQTGQVRTVEKLYDLRAGKYDLTVKSGPSFSTRREEFVALATELIRAMPAAAPLLIDKIVENFDLPGGEELAQRFKALLPPEARGEDPRINEAKEAVQKLTEALKGVQAELEAERQDHGIQAEKVKVDLYNAQTNRMKVLGGGEDLQLPHRVEQLETLIGRILAGLTPAA